MTLLESYKDRIAISEKVYGRVNNGEAMPSAKKLAVARLLDNTKRFLNEAFENSTGTQRSAMGDFKKFCLNLTTVSVPTLIAFDLVRVEPMSSITGYIAYVKYTAGSNKGTTTQGEVFNDPFRLGKVDVNYTASRVVEEATLDAQVKAKLLWTPVMVTEAGKLAEGKIVKVSDGSEITNYTVTKAGEITVTSGAVATDKIKVAYVYDNVVIPQNDLPVLNAEMASITLYAKARRIAVYYSQIAAFQAKTDYGFDLGDQLAEKAVGQLNYEIDTEVTDLLINNASEADELVWSKTLPLGVSLMEHYASFTQMIEIGKQKIYDRTKRFAPNYMLIASDILPVLSFVPSFKAANTAAFNGPYFAGTLNGLKVYVTPNIAAGKFVLGVNNNDLEGTAAVYAPYMPVVPTALLQYADGGNSQGFSTMYDLKILNADLLVAGRITA